MAKTPAAQTPQQNDPYLVIRNLTSALTELELQNNMLRTRAAENACRADRATEYAQHLEGRVAELEGASEEAGEAVAETVPFVPAPKKRQPKAA